MIGLIVKSFEKGKEYLVKYVIIIMTFRLAVVCLDFEGYRLRKNNLKVLEIICSNGISALLG